MRAMTAPSHIPLQVFQECTNSISNINLRSRLNAVRQNIDNAANEYQVKASSGLLYSIPPNYSDNNAIVVGAVTKKELKDVYSVHMVPRKKPARKIYDSVLAQAPRGRCPFCGFGHASTLDHYLPKSKYPQFSVLPLNIVPSCKDCNTGKLADIAITEEQQSLHPYFDHAQYVDEQWLFAVVEQTSPVTIRFYVQAPGHWTDISKSRVRAHFKEFKLASRYIIEASSQLACLRDTLMRYSETNGAAAVKQHLTIEAHTYFRQHKNSWQTAMFQSLANSDWYCDSGFH